jgi:hypothetical protein
MARDAIALLPGPRPNKILVRHAGWVSESAIALTFRWGISTILGRAPLGGQQWGTVLNKLRVKDNTRGQFQIRMTTTDGTITCVVAPPVDEGVLAQRRDTALQLAKRLARRLDEAIKPAPVTAIGTRVSVRLAAAESLGRD